jgi:hypothetical protein
LTGVAATLTGVVAPGLLRAVPTGHTAHGLGAVPGIALADDVLIGGLPAVLLHADHSTFDPHASPVSTTNLIIG